jgi:hypothetical protein
MTSFKNLLKYVAFEDALESPTRTQLHTHMTLNSQLMPLQEALKAQSAAELNAYK